jgi:type II secretory pathway pseudopilin PulG
MPAERQRGFHRLPRRRGVTVVEVIVACAILAVVAIATGAYLHVARAQAALQRNRRTALGVANTRLEALRGAAYPSVRPPSLNYNLYYLDFLTGAWRVSDFNRGETARFSGVARPMLTTVRYVDAAGGGTAYDCLRLAVSVQYGGSAGQVVRLETLRTP